MLEFVAKVVVVSSSGALAPGPLSAATAAIGVKNGWKGGFMVSTGHFIVELPLVLIIAFFISTYGGIEGILRPLALIGGSFLLFFGYLTVKSALQTEEISGKDKNFSPLLTGIALTALNPFFIAWWFGVGSVLISESILTFGLIGIAILFVSHIWIDFAFLSFLAYITSFKGLTLRAYKFLLLSLGILVLFFGLDYIYFALTGMHIF
ncbi:MAG: LysE family translocator [Archaeoglobaceae archaeon]|nr:LysE family translocator [Archaeoglobaceae archaeon]MDW8127832.1 LysE family transporter [Archaeoglobaceae archaeon]